MDIHEGRFGEFAYKHNKNTQRKKFLPIADFAPHKLEFAIDEFINMSHFGDIVMSESDFKLFLRADKALEIYKTGNIYNNRRNPLDGVDQIKFYGAIIAERENALRECREEGMNCNMMNEREKIIDREVCEEYRLDIGEDISLQKYTGRKIKKSKTCISHLTDVNIKLTKITKKLGC